MLMHPLLTLQLHVAKNASTDSDTPSKCNRQETSHAAASAVIGTMLTACKTCSATHGLQAKSCRCGEGMSKGRTWQLLL